MPAVTLTVGDVEITAILDVDTSMPLAEIFDGSGDPPPGGSEFLAATYPDEFTADAWRFRDHCFLVRTPTRLTLIDTGGGPDDSAFGRWLGAGGTLPDELAALGVMPDDVDDVILTHIHSDPRGGTRRRRRVDGFRGSRMPGTTFTTPTSRGCEGSSMQRTSGSSPR